MSGAPLADVVDAHIARADDTTRLVRRTPIEHAPEHLDANRQPLHAPDRVGVTLGRIASEQTARADLAGLEARNAELQAARERINAELEENTRQRTAWHKANGHGNAASDAHLFEHHGEHTYLGLDDPNAMLRARDEQIAQLEQDNARLRGDDQEEKP